MNLGNKKIFYPESVLLYFESSPLGLWYFIDELINKLQKVGIYLKAVFTFLWGIATSYLPFF